MQINYPGAYEKDRTMHAPMWYNVNSDAELRDLMVPMVYAPYPMQPFWPPSFSGAGIGNGAPTVGTPAAAPTPSAAAMMGQSLSPITLKQPLPSITTPPADMVSSMQMPPQPSVTWCAVENWVNKNPALAALSAVAVFFIVKGGQR